MFKVIDNYFQNPKYKITTDNNIIEDFKVDILNESADIAARELEAKAIEVEILKTEIIQLNFEFNEGKVVHAQIINNIIESKTKLKKNLVKVDYTIFFKEL
jgi:hypothetical protein